MNDQNTATLLYAACCIERNNEKIQRYRTVNVIVRCLLSDVFSRLQAMKREIHLRELQLLDAVRRRFMHHQQTLKEAELQRLDDEIERKVSTTTGTPAIPLKVIKC